LVLCTSRRRGRVVQGCIDGIDGTGKASGRACPGGGAVHREVAGWGFLGGRAQGAIGAASPGRGCCSSAGSRNPGRRGDAAAGAVWGRGVRGGARTRWPGIGAQTKPPGGSAVADESGLLSAARGAGGRRPPGGGAASRGAWPPQLPALVQAAGVARPPVAVVGRRWGGIARGRGGVRLGRDNAGSAFFQSNHLYIGTTGCRFLVYNRF
jgi:hypothetical protein